MRLGRLLGDVEVLERRGDAESVEVTSVTHDSRQVRPGALFCCVRGVVTDGHQHAAAAVSAGAVALLCERSLPLDVVQVRVRDARSATGLVAAAFHGHPSRAMTVVGVTGTNGKTTTIHLLRSILDAHGWPTATVGTLSGPRTTPAAPDLQALLAGELAAGRRAVAMEVSSHALDQRRVDGVRFAAVAFTNLSQEHLDYHLDMEAYYRAKASLFEAGRAERGVVNVDDEYGRRLVDEASIPVEPYSLRDAHDLSATPRGSRFRWEGHWVDLHLGGRFNVANAVAAATVARGLGVPADTVAAGLSSLTVVPGRFEHVDAGQPFTVVVDYAHTPLALEQALVAARQVASGGRVILVFGCGGDRDTAKRPVMGEVATRMADVAVLTSDNPRHEDPAAIIEQVRAGVARPERLVVEPDRQAAIDAAVARAGPGDAVVVAGKGHETGQVVGDRVIPFDDREAVRRALAATADRVGP
ncbi:MAG TPA: UDP-N-acetylmuramoyl-L-alanyl-D-glutamate--2,6-diaminopimelate ligase [Acidimicrobiales bacterium]|nr:UDP-N-acetylmuramoyl-L-alanyl-D-glutamate--2,6-diaminopimelate ligase [Acidimicrobiales bacterium]